MAIDQYNLAAVGVCVTWLLATQLLESKALCVVPLSETCRLLTQKSSFFVSDQAVELMKGLVMQVMTLRNKAVICQLVLMLFMWNTFWCSFQRGQQLQMPDLGEMPAMSTSLWP